MASFPKIIVVVNGKGGVGKTTTVMSLAGILAEKYKVLAVDADVQGSFSWWAERAGKSIGFDLAQEVDPALLSHLRQVEGYELVAIDTPPALHSQTLAAAIAIADYLILPTPPTPLDLAALIETVRTAIAPLGTPHRVLLTRVDSRRIREAQEAQNTLRELGVPAFNQFIRAYKAHERAALEGIPINQWQGENASEAKADYYRVADELQRDWEKNYG